MILTNDTIKELKERNSGSAMELLQTLDSLNKLIGHDDVSNNLSKNADTIAEAVIVRIDKDKLNNSTQLFMLRQWLPT